MDPYYGSLRRADLLAEAAENRVRRECRRPGLALRLYMRVWWASRPRVGSRPRGVLEACDGRDRRPGTRTRVGSFQITGVAARRGRCRSSTRRSGRLPCRRHRTGRSDLRIAVLVPGRPDSAAAAPIRRSPAVGWGLVGFRVVPAAYVLLIDGDGRVLLQLRAGTGYRDGFWAAAAAGHVEAGEAVRAAARREAVEELGVQVAELVPLTTMHRTNGTGLEIDERVDFFFTCRRWSGEPRTMEPTKSAGLGWYALDTLPEPVVPHERFVLDGLRSGDLPAITAFGFA